MQRSCSHSAADTLLSAHPARPSLTLFHSAFGMLALVLMLLLTGCAKTTALQLHTETLAAHAPFVPVLLAAQSTEADARLRWEKSCLARFQKQGIAAEAAHQYLPEQHYNTENTLITLAEQNGFESLLTVDLTTWLNRLELPRQANLMDREAVQFADPAIEIQLGDGTLAGPQAEVGQNFPVKMFDSESGEVMLVALLVTHEANDINKIAASQCDALAALLQQHYAE